MSVGSRHAPNPTDFEVTLCNVKREGKPHETLFAPVMAKRGETIQCGRCRAVIKLVRDMIGPRYVLTKDPERLRT